MEKVFTINPESSLLTKKIECAEVQELFGAEFFINYPKSVYPGKASLIQVDIIKTGIEHDSAIWDDALKSCEVFFEVRIDAKDIRIEPGNKIIKPFVNRSSQLVQFEVFSMKNQEIKGTLWINVFFPDRNETVLERIPIFAIPFNIQTRSLLGMPVQIVKLFSYFILAIAMLMFLLVKDQGKIRK